MAGFAASGGADLFSSIDKDGNGSISRAEFEQIMASQFAAQVGGSSGSLGAVYAAPASAVASSMLPVYGGASAPVAGSQVAGTSPMGTMGSLNALVNGAVASSLSHNVQYEPTEFEPEYIERVVEVPRIRVDHVEKIVEVPEVQMVDRIVEIPMVQDVLEMSDDSYARYGGAGGCGGYGGCGGCGGGAPHDFGRRPYDLGSSAGMYPYWGDEGGGGCGPGGKGGGKGKGGRGRGNLPVKVITREVPKVEVRQVERQVEVPNIEYADRLVEVKEVREVVRRVPRVEVREIPIERIIQVPKKIVQEIEKPVYRPVPHLVKQQVEKEIPIPKQYIQTVEVVKQMAVPTSESGEVMSYNSLVDSSPAPPMAQENVVHPSVVINQYTLPPQSVPAPLPSMQFPGASAGPVGSVGSMSCVAAPGPAYPSSMASMTGTGRPTPPMPPPSSVTFSQSLPGGAPIAPQSGVQASGQAVADQAQASQLFGGQQFASTMVSGQQAGMTIVPGSMQAVQSLPGTGTGYMTPPTPPLGSRTMVPAAAGSIATGSMAAGSMPYGSMAGPQVFAMTPGAGMPGSVQIPASALQSGIVQGTMFMPGQTQQASGAAQFASMGLQPTASRGNPFGSGCVGSAQSMSIPTTGAGGAQMMSSANLPPGSLQMGNSMASGMYQTYAGAATPPMAPGSSMSASDLFDKLDKDGTGAISRAELEQGLAAMRSGVLTH